MNNSNITQANTLHPTTLTASSKDTIIDTNTLFKSGNVVFIQHQGQEYHLRRTRSGKLILTK